ncbi:MAG: HNH endonuclease, partial [Actinomycetota bacterium]|nr:HNH endonuclease [Actinomycetota bacterium]
LEESALSTQEAMARGELGMGQVQVIAKTMGGLPEDLTQAQREAAETTLIGDAQRLTLKDLRRRADRIADVFAPDQVDQVEQRTLVERERAARARTEFWMIDQRDGTHKGGFVIPDLHADMLKTMIDAIAAPRRDHLRPEEIDVFGDLTYPQRMGLGFLELLEHVPGDRLPAGGTALTVNFDYEQLVSGIGAATLSTGTRVSINQVRKMACDLNLIPMVFNGKSLPMDFGQPQRLFTRWQKIAIANRDGGCTFPGCDRPPNWCEVHHGRIPWALGGRTDLADGVLLCNLHHHVVHDDEWAVRFASDGHPEYVPPKTVDFGQQPRRNQRRNAKQAC